MRIHVTVHVHHHPDEQLLRELEGLRADVRALRPLGEAILGKEDQALAAIDDLNAVATDIRTETDLIGTKVDDAIIRLSDNPTAEAVAAVVTSLQGVKDSLGTVGSKVDSIDPAVAGGVIPPGTSISVPGDVPATDAPPAGGGDGGGGAPPA